MFKALIISYYFPPMGMTGVHRTLKFAKYMKKFNWEPTVLTGNGYSQHVYDLELLREAELSQIKIVRTSEFDPHSVIRKREKINLMRDKIRLRYEEMTKFVHIPDNKISWIKDAYIKAKELLSSENFDVIMVCCPPFSSFILAAKLKKEFDLPLFVDYRDLWTNISEERSITPYHRVKNKKLEYTCLKAADKVIAVNRKIKEKLLLSYPFLTFDDIIIIPHGIDLEDFDLKKQKFSDLNKSDIGDKIIITYAIGLNRYSSPKTFFEAIKKVNSEYPEIAKKIEINIIGNLKELHNVYIKKLGIGNLIKFHGNLEYHKSLELMMESDILLTILDDAKNTSVYTGAKLSDYFGTQKTILSLVPDGAAKNALQEYGAAIICQPNSVEDIKHQILNIHRLKLNNLLPKPNQEFVEKINCEFQTEQLTKEFQFFIKEI